GIVAGAAVESVVPGAADEHVVAGATEQDVVTAAAVQLVVAGIAGDGVVPAVAGPVQIGRPGQDQVLDRVVEAMADAALHRVDAGGVLLHHGVVGMVDVVVVVTRAAGHHVGAAPAVDHVSRPGARQLVVSAGPGDGRRRAHPDGFGIRRRLGIRLRLGLGLRL